MTIRGGPAPSRGSPAQGQALHLQAQKLREKGLPRLSANAGLRLGTGQPQNADMCTTKGMPGATAPRGIVLAMVDQLHVTVRAKGISLNGLTEMLVKPSPVT